MEFKTTDDILSALGPCAQVAQAGLQVKDWAAFRTTAIDRLAWNAVFAQDAAVRDACRWLCRAAAHAQGAFAASIHELYLARGRGEHAGFAVPAVNIRGMTYDVARAIFRTATKLNAGPVICEIARSEIGYTFQRPSEYAALIFAAACKEGWTGPVFVQGDHFQTNAKKFADDPAKEAGEIRKLIDEAVPAGFLNIDIDTSTLVNLTPPAIAEQQRANYENCAAFTKHIRSLEPKGVTVSVGGEIGEVGFKNSTVEELSAFMDGYRAALPEGMAGISKMSVQTGTSHGGIPLPDGTVAKVDIDFDTLKAISDAARTKYGLGGAVQHGASTLPEALFDRFPQTGTGEIHLATEFQNMMLDHPQFPASLRERMFQWCRDHCKDEMKEGQTDKQFVYKTRKKAWGPFRKEVWELPEAAKAAIRGSLEAKFETLFRKLGLAGTRGALAAIRHARVLPAAPAALTGKAAGA